MRRRIAIIGGGVSGLSAAFDLAQAGLEFELFEAEDRLGGMLRTSHANGFVIEHGADSWIAQKPAAEELARELGLADEIIVSPAISASTAILRNGRLWPLPPGMRLFIPTDLAAAEGSPLFSEQTKRRLREELEFLPRPVGEESIAAFVERHFGRELLDVVAAPLLAGVYGGDAAKLSAQSVVPGIVALEEQYGSLIRGARLQGSPANTGTFRCLRSGMETLISALRSRVPNGHLHLCSAVTRVAPARSGYTVTANDCEQEFSSVLFSMRLPGVARLLRIDLPKMDYSSAVTVAVAYSQRPSLPPGFGFLAASGEDAAILAATFVHQKWPDRVPPGRALIRAFMDRSRIFGTSDEEIISDVSGELRRILGVVEQPLMSWVDYWPDSMPQYHVGHERRVGEIRARMEGIGAGLHLAGNSFDGVGISDAVRTGRAAAKAIIAQQQK